MAVRINWISVASFLLLALVTLATLGMVIYLTTEVSRNHKKWRGEECPDPVCMLGDDTEASMVGAVSGVLGAKLEALSASLAARINGLQSSIQSYKAPSHDTDHPSCPPSMGACIEPVLDELDSISETLLGTCDHVSYDVAHVLRNVIRHNQTAGSVPADPYAAPGDDTDGGRVIVVNNVNVTIIHKTTHQKLFSTDLSTFFGVAFGFTDPYVIWDAYHSRFFLVAWDYQFSPNIESFYFIAVSKTAAPSTASDFYTYGPIVSPSHANSIADYGKISVDDRALYLSTADFLGPPGDTADLLALDKADLLDGTGLTVLWTHVLPPPGGSPGLLFPVERRLPATDLSQPMFFAGFTVNPFFGDPIEPATIMRFFTGTADGLDPTPIDVELPTPVSVIIGYVTGVPGARQPPPAVPKDLSTETWAVHGGVVSQDRLILVHGHNSSSVQSLVRWYEFDVSQVAVTRTITLTQWSDIYVDPSVDTFFPSVDINKHGDVCIGFSMSGTDQYVVPAYTCRLASDPLNTIRYPVITAVDNEFTYFESNSANPNARNRWGDYSGMRVDPANGETFWGCNMRPDPVGLFGPPFAYGYCNKSTTDCIARDWTMDIWNFKIDKDPCATGTVTEPLNNVAPQGGEYQVAMHALHHGVGNKNFNPPPGVRPASYPGGDDDEEEELEQMRGRGNRH